MLTALLILTVAYISGVTGYVAGRAHKEAALEAYKAGLEDAHRQTLEQVRASGGPCWVRGQLPPSAQ